MKRLWQFYVMLVVAALTTVVLVAQQPVAQSGNWSVRLQDGSGNAITSTASALDINIKSGNPTTITVTQATGTNLHAVLDTTSTTAVTQATGTNLHAVLDTTSTTAVTQATASNLNADVNLKTIGATTVVTGGVNGSLGVGGTVATNVAITANPLNLGAQAVSSENSAVTTARQVQLVADLVGKLIILPYANPENFLDGTITTSMTSTTSTAVTNMGAQGGSLRVYVTSCTVSNASATVGTDVILQDGSGGTTLYTMPAPYGYGGSVVSFPTPIKTTANTALFAANVTTGASTKVSCTGYKGL